MKGRKIFAIHSILGLIAGLLLLVVSLSGSVLVFSEEIDQQLNPPLLKVVATKNRASLDSIYKKALTVFPGSYIRFRQIPADPERSLELSVEQGELWTFAYFDPYSGNYLGSRNARNYFLGWLLGLHYGLLAGKTGEFVVGLLSIMLILSVATGVYVYRKHVWNVLTFQVGISTNNRRKFFSSLHRVIGVWTLVFNLGFAITGFWMMKAVFLPETYQEVKPQIKAALPFSISLDALKLSVEKNKDFRVSSIFLPKTGQNNITLLGAAKGQSSIYNEFANSIEVNSKTGKEESRVFIEDQSAWNKWDMIVLPLHAGLYGNFLVKIIYCILGVSPALLSISGFFLWMKRKKIFS